MLCDMIPTGFHGVELADVQFGDKVLVIGIGPVGLMSVAGAAIRGASEIYAVGSRPNCIEIAKEFGATHIINYRNGSIEEQVMNLTSGKGVDKVVIAAGLMPGGRLRMEKLISLIETKRICPSRLVTHQFHGFDKVEEALLMMKDKPKDLIKPIVFID